MRRILDGWLSWRQGTSAETEVDRRSHKLRGIADAIEFRFPDDARTLRAIATTLEEA